MRRITNIRRANSLFDVRSNVNGLVTCKLACDAKFPFNRTKRQACKDQCEADNLASATSTYGGGGTTTAGGGGTTAPGGTTTPYIPPTQPPGTQATLIPGVDNQTLMIGAIAIGGVILLTKDKKKKRR